jgi:integrase
MPRKKPDLTLCQLVEKFASTKKNSISPNGFARYTATLYWVKRLCPELLVKNIRQVAIDNLAEKMGKAMESDRREQESDRAVNPKTITGYFSVIRAAVCWDCRRREIPAPVWQLPEFSGKTPKKKPKAFSTQQVMEILAAFKNAHPEYFDYVYFLLSTAVRPGELNSLTWDKVLPGYGAVKINASFSRGVAKDSTKTGIERVVHLAPDVSEMLQRRSVPHTGLIFVDGQGRQIDDRRFRRIWQRVLARAGIDYLKPYNTRSTAISLALNSGADPVKVAAGAGHDPVTMFRNYGDLISKDNPFVSLATLGDR